MLSTPPLPKRTPTIAASRQEAETASRRVIGSGRRNLLTDTVKNVSITLDYEVQNLDTLFEAAKNALEELRAKTIAEHGKSEDGRYAQPLDQLIQTELHDTATGVLQPSLCVDTTTTTATASDHVMGGEQDTSFSLRSRA
jgi:hypothetical protein